MRYARQYSTRQTPQSQPIPGTSQVKNSAGGFVYQIDKWSRLDRFLILGTEKGTYYAGQRKLTIDNMDNVLACIKQDGTRVVNRVVEVSQEALAPKNDQAIFALMACTASGDLETSRAAWEALPKVCRIGTHWFQAAEGREAFGGWGRSAKRGFGSLYRGDIDRLAYQVVKYRQRGGWSHRDLLRLAHPQAPTDAHNALFRFITKYPDKEWVKDEVLPKIVMGWVFAQDENQTPKYIASLVREYGLTREMLPTKYLNEKVVWEALLEKMPHIALIRNLGKLSNIGLLVDGNWDEVDTVTSKLLNEESIKRSRVHPIQILLALATYRAGHGFRGKMEWPVCSRVVDALDEAFYMAFRNVEPSGKRVMLALDVSGSMYGNLVAGTMLDAATACGAMAMVTAKKEPQFFAFAFSDSTEGRSWYQANANMETFNLSPKMRLDGVIQEMGRLYQYMSGTDCALPMRHALKNSLEVDAFVIYTDSETWQGNIHPSQALREYREKVNPNARLVVVGVTATDFSIADPNDPGSMDVVGFDAAAPQIISNFIAGKI